MYKTTLKINGMMCPMCEAHVNEAVRKTFPGIKKVTSSHAKGTTEILSDEPQIKEHGLESFSHRLSQNIWYFR